MLRQQKDNILWYQHQWDERRYIHRNRTFQQYHVRRAQQSIVIVYPMIMQWGGNTGIHSIP